MWSKIKTIYSYVFRICLALVVILFMVIVFLTLANKELNQNTEMLTNISLVAVLLSMPGIVNTLAEEVSPKKKIYKLSCKCPYCKRLIEMDMKEE
jgi:hypothetical protein